jgi:hypothetical protein
MEVSKLSSMLDLEKEKLKLLENSSMLLSSIETKLLEMLIKDSTLRQKLWDFSLQ